MSESAALTWSEKRSFIPTAVEAVAGRVPFFAGTTALGTRETIAQTREARDLGVDGTMLGVPMWCELDASLALQFYADVACLRPRIGDLCLRKSGGVQVRLFPRVLGWCNRNSAGRYIEVSRHRPSGGGLAVGPGHVRLLPVASQYLDAAQKYPDECVAFWTSAAVCGPAPIIALRDEVTKAKATGNWSEAKRVSDDIKAGSEGLVPNGDREAFYKYNIQLEKARIGAAGWMSVGPCRPPYYRAPADYEAGAAESGKRWAALHNRYNAPIPAVS